MVLNLKLCFFMFSLILYAVKPTIRLIEPSEYRNNVMNEQGHKGELDYSISMFGYIDYLKDYEVEVVTPPESNEYGCKPLDYPTNVSGRFAFLFKKGECTFTKKALNAKLVS